MKYIRHVTFWNCNKIKVPQQRYKYIDCAYNIYLNNKFLFSGQFDGKQHSAIKKDCFQLSSKKTLTALTRGLLIDI